MPPARAAPDSGDCSCPICLEDMNRSEQIVYPLPCERCDFNFCSNCVENFCKAAEDDFQLASDGSRQVKIHVSCPQCRSKYPLEDLEDTVLLLRSAHNLADTIMKRVSVGTKQYGWEDDEDDNDNDETKEDETANNSDNSKTKTKTEYKLARDSDLSASQLARKSEFFASRDLRQQLEEASLLYETAVARGVALRKDISPEQASAQKAKRDDAREMWMALLDQLPAEPDNACRCERPDGFCDGSCGSRNSIEVVLSGSYYNSSPSSSSCQKATSGSSSSNNSNSNSNASNTNGGSSSNRGVQKKPPNTHVDDTLFQGFDEFINRDEKIFLTDLFTDGDVRSVSQAALIMNGVRRLALTGNHHKSNIIRNGGSHSDEPMSKQEMQQHIDHIDQTKLQFPLPNHMPGYFLIPAYSYREGYMTLKDKPFDGHILPPQRSKRCFEQVYGRYYTRPRGADEYPLTVATIQAVRGPVGRLGLRRGDVVTHVDDAEWTGTATDLQAYIYDSHAKHPRNEISITVNANQETCEFLRVRNEMMKRKQKEQKERQKQRALLQRNSAASASAQR